ncbi:MAG: hypothetical protein CBD27_09715 [Rhodospirillaceae bacterium TMED167]|nr:hypothetical protein [Rhodospirillaceae bacterium]OUW25249.1 MAG: hypothetical protein CBD27_09715 [Rhodospirillaceae bacterium TMED167]
MTGSPKGFLSGLQRFTFASPIYNYTLLGRVPDRLLGTPPELLPGNASAGQAVLSGALNFKGRRYPLPSFQALPQKLPEEWCEHLHGFMWLADLRSVGTPQARHRAQVLIADWLSRFDDWEPFAWRPDITGTRLASWITHFAFYAADADVRFCEELFASLARQSRHLSRSSHLANPGLEAVAAQQGLIYAGVAVPESDNYLAQGLELLEAETGKQVLPDGGHVSRNPQTQLRMLRALLEIRDALTAAHIDLPNWLKIVIERMVPMTRALRLGDGALACFHGGSGGERAEIDLILAKSKIKGKPALIAPHTQFHRLSGGKTTLVLDAGVPPTVQANRWAHAGTLAFEMSAGKERLIVNCGSTRQMGPEWHQALRATAAHSTMVVDDINSSELGKNGGLGRRVHTVQCSRREIDGRSVLEVASDGYKGLFDLEHRRFLMMSADGTELLGEDLLIGSGGKRFTVRFHLHPNVQATPIQNGNAVLLKLRRGRGWKLVSPDRKVFLEESVYFEENSRCRRTQQIVIPGEILDRGAAVKWRFIQI